MESIKRKVQDEGLDEPESDIFSRLRTSHLLSVSFLQTALKMTKTQMIPSHSGRQISTVQHSPPVTML